MERLIKTQGHSGRSRKRLMMTLGSKYALRGQDEDPEVRMHAQKREWLCRCQNEYSEVRSSQKAKPAGICQKEHWTIFTSWNSKVGVSIHSLRVVLCGSGASTSDCFEPKSCATVGKMPQILFLLLPPGMTKHNHSKFPFLMCWGYGATVDMRVSIPTQCLHHIIEMFHRDRCISLMRVPW